MSSVAEACEVVVIGAGVTGLTLGWLLSARGVDVRVVEAAARPGGVIATQRIDGCVIEAGPQSLRGATPAVWDLLGALGLRGAALPAADAAKKRFLLQGGALVPAPDGLGAFLRTPLMSRRARLRVLLEPLVPRGGTPGESVYDLIARRLGRGAADRLVDPIVAGISGGDPREVEAEALLGRFVGWERDAGSLVRGAFGSPRSPAGAPKSMFTLRGGLSTLSDALAHGLGERLACDTAVHAVRRDGERLRVVTASGDLLARRVMVCAPAAAAAKFLPDLGDALDVPMAPLAAIHLGWRVGDVAAPEGFGWLSHPSERADVLGAIYVSSVFPAHTPDRVVVRVMVGGVHAPELVSRADGALVAHAAAVLRELQGLAVPPVFTHVARAAIPQYVKGHLARLQRLASADPALRFVGWSYGGIGIADAIEAAFAAADSLTPR